MTVVSFTGYRPGARDDGRPWVSVRIDESTDQAGEWSTIDTLALDPVDDDPRYPAMRSFTTEEATLTDGWFRVVFLDADGDEDPTTPVQRGAASPYPQILAMVDVLLQKKGEAGQYDPTLKELAIEIALNIVETEIGTTYFERSATSTVEVEPYRERFALPVYAPVLSVSAIDGPAGSVDPATVRLYGRRLISTSYWPAGFYDVTYTYGQGTPPLHVSQAIALVAADAVKAGPVSDRGYTVTDEAGIVRMLTAGVAGAAVSIPEVQASINRERLTQVGGF